MKSVIIAHGDLGDGKVAIRECKEANYIICADGGAEHAYSLNILPHFILGDFDSVSEKVLSYFKSRSVEIIKYPREKDYTDTEICIQKAIDLGSSEICILAGVGSRIDHNLGNIGLLHIIKRNGIRGYIASDKCYIYLCSDEIEIVGNKGDVVSIFAYDGDVKGITLKGLKYLLNDANLEFGRPLGISNEMVENKCSIKVKSGELLVIKYNINLLH
jgi:thiamine pyrophosphokinase